MGQVRAFFCVSIDPDDSLNLMGSNAVFLLVVFITVNWMPPETFQFVTFTSHDHKDGEHTCFYYQNKHVK